MIKLFLIPLFFMTQDANIFAFRTSDKVKQQDESQFFNDEKVENTSQITFTVLFQFDEPRYYEICGGAIISPVHILTAAHCFSMCNTNALNPEFYNVTLDVSKVKVKIGCSSKFQQEEIGHCEFYDVRSFITTEIWELNKCDDDASYFNGGDLAIVSLARPISEAMFDDKRATTLNLPNMRDEVVDLPLVMMGYGIGRNGANGYLKYHRNMSLVSFYEFSVGDCLYTSVKNRLCLGDSGSPLLQLNSTSATVIGIGVRGFNCSDDDVPVGGVYTDVRKYLPWINTSIGNA